MRRHVSYANVAATLALVLSMGGGALAANHYLINSTKQINPKVLKKLKGKTGKTGPQGVGGPIGPLGSTGPQGAKGPQGTEGAKGAAGETGPPGQARAYATITPGSPATIQPGSRGIASATTFSNITCVFPDPSIELATIVAVVTSQFGDLTFSADPGGCSTGGKTGIQVNGFNQTGTANITGAFSIVIP
jgi:hypothetical protein